MIRSVFKTKVSAPADLRPGAGYLSSIACGGTLGTRCFFSRTTGSFVSLATSPQVFDRRRGSLFKT